MKCPETHRKTLSAGPRIIKRKDVLARPLLVEFDGEEVSGLRLVRGLNVLDLSRTPFQLCSGIQIAGGLEAKSGELHLVVIIGVEIH